MWFMLAAGARPKETKINLMDCICLCSEVEMKRMGLTLKKCQVSMTPRGRSTLLRLSTTKDLKGSFAPFSACGISHFGLMV